jgi:hypothetical protein
MTIAPAARIMDLELRTSNKGLHGDVSSGKKPEMWFGNALARTARLS